MSAETWKLSLPCTRAEAEALTVGSPELAELTLPPALITSEPDPAQPDRWQLDAYFEGRPDRVTMKRVAALVPSARKVELKARLVPPADWVTVSQAGFEPIDAGRFRVRTPDHRAKAGAVDLVIPAGLAFGTGQHATTRGCLEMLDELKRQGKVFRNILDLGTGSGVLAFAAQRVWPTAALAASDVDPVSIAVVRENAALNGVRPPVLVVADGLADRTLVAHAPYDLVIANILATPLIGMAASIAASVTPHGTLILAGLLNTQADAVATAYRRQRMRVVSSRGGEWPVLVMRKR